MKQSFLGALLASVLWWQACSVPAWVNTVEQDAEVAAPIAASLVDVIDPALAPLVNLVDNGFQALVKTLDTFKSSPTATNLQAVQSAFSAVNANVAQLESAAQIKNPAADAKVSAIVQLLAQAVTEIAAQVPASAGYGLGETGNGTATAAPAVKHWKASDLKRQFNQIVNGDPRFKPLQ